MKKYSFLLLLMLCLCGKVWGYTVTFPQLSKKDTDEKDYTQTSNGITFTLGKVKYWYGSGSNCYYIERNSSATISWTSPSNPNQCIKITSIAFRGRTYKGGNPVSVKTSFDDNTSVTLFNSSDMSDVTISVSSNSNIMSSVGLINGDVITLLTSKGGLTNDCKGEFETITITFDIVTTPILPYIVGNSNQEAAYNAFMNKYNEVKNFSEDNTKPQWIRDYASRLIVENHIATLSNYSTKISNLNAYSALYSAYTANTTPTDFTATIANPDFQASNWWTGWTGTCGSDDTSDDTKKANFAKQTGDGTGNNKNHFTSGTIFAEMWAAKNNTLSAGDLNQTVRLPQGVYKLSADVRNRRITSYLYASINGVDLATCACNVDEVTNSSILFAVDTESDVQIGYRHAQTTSSEGDVWTAIDNVTLKFVSKLDLNITGSNITEGFYVGDEIESGIAYAYSDTYFSVGTPGEGSNSGDFYYTITTNTISSVTTGCESGYEDKVITYDPSTNKIKAWNAGTATITFCHKETSTVNPKNQSYNIVVSKITNPISVTLGGVSRNTLNIGYTQADFALSYTSPSDVDYSVTHRDGGSNAVSLNDAKNTFSLPSTKIEGVDYWDIVQEENYKYERGSAFVRIQVNKVAETESYLHDGSSTKSEISSGKVYEINLDYAPLYITYLAWNEGAAIAQKSVCKWYDASGNELGTQNGSLSSTASRKTVDLPANARKITITDSGWGSKFVSNVQVVRRTYIDVTADNTDLGGVYVGNTASTNLNIGWGTSNGGNLTVESNNSRFEVSASSVTVTANSNGATTLTVTYTPTADYAGADEAMITVRDAYHVEHITLTATTLKQKSLVYGYALMYNAAKNIQIDDAGVAVYDATFDAGTQIVSLNQRTVVSGKIIIPAGKVVLLYKAEDSAKASSTIDYEYTSADANIAIDENNCFVHHDGNASGLLNYVLANPSGNSNQVAFYRYTGAESNLSGYNVLQLPEVSTVAPSVIRIVTEGNTATALMPVEADEAVQGQNNDQIYTILGIPVSDMSQPGIYIKNGKKYIIK